MHRAFAFALIAAAVVGPPTAGAGLPPVSVPPYHKDCPLERLPASCVPQWVQDGPDVPAGLEEPAGAPEGVVTAPRFTG